MISTEHGFQALFQGNLFAYGADHGECIRSCPSFSAHLSIPGRSVGVYPIFGEQCSWGCVDLDVRSDTHPNGDYATESGASLAARDLLLALDALNLTGWAEVTRSRGRHVWVFAQQPVPARVMRRALLVACQVAETKPTEVNPKQESLPDGSLGNYVRLPYPYGEDTTRYMYNDKIKYTLTEFVRSAMAQRATPQDLEAAADLYTPPAPRVRFTPVALPNLGQSGLMDRIGPAGRSIVRDGVLDGSDRSGTLVRLAGICCRAGLTTSEALAIVEEADVTSIQKYVNRRDAQRRYEDIVAAGYS